ncbi:alpha/beta-hydrolase [Calocera cornea HHB12733]|uniref:Alpha/beta-hydrolase n=1 Tax=Calocera cornea HHB12733 TaxID=1353952 RepID=A0A165JB61_9BASI|nr:alpha/beta-hydrolase [Calocera cornea HHB12733]
MSTILYDIVASVMMNGPARTLTYPGGVMCQRRTKVVTPDQYRLPYELVELVTCDNVQLTAYSIVQQARKIERFPGERGPEYIVSPSQATICDDRSQSMQDPRQRPTVLFLHGNSGNIGDRLPFAYSFYKKMSCNVFLLEYRGYGSSQGRPSEAGIQIDAETAFQYIKSHPVLGHTKLFVYGESFGGAVAIDLAARHPGEIDALICANTFLSLRKVISQYYTRVSGFMNMLNSEVWDCESKLPLIPTSIPMLFLSGLKDELVPPAHMRRLYEIACRDGEERKTWWTSAYGDHNSTFLEGTYWSAVQKFVSKWSGDDEITRGCCS